MWREILIDGSNLTHAAARRSGSATAGGSPSRSDLTAVRRGLLQRLDELAASLSAQVRIVFDGSSPRQALEYATGCVAVQVAPAPLSADSVIERIVRESGDPAGLLVVTSDRGERDGVTANGAEAMSCTQFLDWLDEGSTSVHERVRRVPTRMPRTTLGDLLK